MATQAHSSGEEHSLEEALARARAHLLARQRIDGAWSGVNRSGAAETSLGLVVLRFVDRLDPRDAERGAYWLRQQQLDDGSFPAYPGAPRGSYFISCGGYAALRACGVPATDPSVRRALAYLERHGGRDASPYIVRLVLAMAGEVDARALPPVPLVFKRFRGFEDQAARFVGPWTLLLANALAGLVHVLRAKDRGSSAAVKNARSRIVSYLSARQNPAGHWFGSLVCTGFSLAALHSLGVPHDDDRLQRAFEAMNHWRIDEGDTVSFVPWRSEVWDTSWTLHALVLAGLDRSSTRARRAVSYLIGEQAPPNPFKDLQNRPKGVDGPGGWGFCEGNALFPDCDDTGFVLSALKLACGDAPLPREQEALRCGLAWLIGMQNDDGGWPAWARGHRAKGPGAMANGSLVEALSDPSHEDVTARVLGTLGQFGLAKYDPPVARAIRFLKAQRDKNGVWWGRWAVNYLITTGCVLSGLAAVGEDMSEPYVAHAIRWIREHQNRDGGWGEGVDSYHDIQQAGVGRSGPSVTAFVVCGLIDAGLAGSETVRRGIAYLLARQSADGTWRDDDVQGVMFPTTDQYYYNEYLPKYVPLQALAKYRAARFRRSLVSR